jgi:hypothetical protein
MRTSRYDGLHLPRPVSNGGLMHRTLLRFTRRRLCLFRNLTWRNRLHRCT